MFSDMICMHDCVLSTSIIMQRKFVRENATVPNNFFAKFREWLDFNFPTFTEDIWKEIMAEDANVDYSMVGSGMHVSEEEIIPHDDHELDDL